jgi:hypothetical protein
MVRHAYFVPSLLPLLPQHATHGTSRKEGIPQQRDFDLCLPSFLTENTNKLDSGKKKTHHSLNYPTFYLLREVTMLANKDVSSFLMRKALQRTIIALENAAELDPERKSDKEFFAVEQDKLNPLFLDLTVAERAFEDFELGDGLKQQARVLIGDAILDNGVRKGNSLTKTHLKGKSGLGASHAFGDNIADVTEEEIEIEPSVVLTIAERMKDLPDFPGKEEIRADLILRATQQQQNVNARRTGEAEYDKRRSATTVLVTKAATALIQAQGALQNRFPEDKRYVRSFFLDVTRPAKEKQDPKVTAIFATFAALDIPVSDEASKKISKTTEQETLTRWVKRAAAVSSADELFI